MPAPRAVLTVTLDLLPEAVQPEVGSAGDSLHAYSSLAAFVAAMVLLSAPLELAIVPTLTVGLTAVLTVTVVLGVPLLEEFVPLPSLISLI